MAEHTTTSPRPLCIDLDGTLVKTDTFAQALLQLIRTRPSALFALPGRARGGLAALKQKVAREVRLEPAALPYHTALVGLLKSEKGKGRELILVTASDKTPAQAIADHVGLFDEVLASDGLINLKAARKRDALVARFGEQGFDYVGNSTDDLTVWEAAAGIIAVNPDIRVRRALRNKQARVFEDRPPHWKAWFRTLRVHQWVKNVLIFLPMLLAHELTTPALYLKAALAFAAFSLTASAIYVLNDLMDLHADQHHPRKRTRPLAAGDLSLSAAAVTVPCLLLAALLIAAFLTPAFWVILLVYLLITTLYSWCIKQMALLDVLTLAGFYAIRIIAGTAAYGVASSPWLIAFSIFIFFSLAVVKRYAELLEVSKDQTLKIEVRGRSYLASDLPLLAAFGACSGVVSVLVLALYINSEKVAQFYNRPELLWLLCPVLLYWIARIWLLAGRGEIPDDPLDFASRDPHTWVIGALSALILLLGSF